MQSPSLLYVTACVFLVACVCLSMTNARETPAPSKKFLSIWLSPSQSDPHTAGIEDIVKNGGGPVFSPHVTLLPLTTTLEDWPKIEPLLSQIAGDVEGVINIPFFNLKFGNTFYQSVILEAQKVEPLMLLAAQMYSSVGKYFGPSIPPYYPHMSLYYGNYTSETTTKITDMVKDYGLLNVGIEFDRMVVWTTDDDVPSWIFLGDYLLGDPVFRPNKSG